MFFWKFLMKPVVFLIALLTFIVSLMVIIRSNELGLLREFAALRLVDPLPKATKLVKAGKICEALEYLDLAREYDHVKKDPRVDRFYRETKATRNSYSFWAKQLLEGVWYGKGDCPEALVSATVTDFLVIGDVRDLVLEEMKRYRGEDADEFIEALAGVGIILTGVTVMTGGGAAPARGSLSVLKISKKLGKLTRPLEKSLVTIFRQARKTGNLKGVTRLSRSLYRLARIPHLRKHIFFVLSKCRNAREIARMEKVAARFGKKTVKFLKLGGDTSLDVFRKFGKDKALVRAMDAALQYGSDGSRLVKKTGPTRFMKYLRMTKIGVRATRSAYQGRLTSLLVKISEMLPLAVLYAVCALSGLPVLWAPLNRAVKFGLRPRRFAKASQ